MRRNTRSRTAANARFQANLTSLVHRLPNELLAHIFVMGCPAPNHKFIGIDKAPFRYQVLVGSICGLWRKIAHECPSLWTSIVIFYPMRRKLPLGFYEEMISVILGRSGTLRLDLSVRFHRHPGLSGAHYNHIIAHLQRAHTLDVYFKYRIDLAHIPELLNLRHFYAKTNAIGGIPFSPSFGQMPPLETLYYQSPDPLNLPALPAGLRYCHIDQGHIGEHTTRLVNKCNELRVLELMADIWEPAACISPSTLTHLDLCGWRELPLNGPLAEGLPNLLHLRLRVESPHASPIHPPSWTPLPSLRSLSIEFRADGMFNERNGGADVIEILRGAPRLVALQMDVIDAPDVIEFICTHWEEEIGDGVGRKPLGLLILMAWDDLEDFAQLLHSWDPGAPTEGVLDGPCAGLPWRLQQCIHRIKICGCEVRQEAYDIEFQPPLSVLADQIAA